MDGFTALMLIGGIGGTLLGVIGLAASPWRR